MLDPAALITAALAVAAHLWHTRHYRRKIAELRQMIRSSQQ